MGADVPAAREGCSETVPVPGPTARRGLFSADFDCIWLGSCTTPALDASIFTYLSCKLIANRRPNDPLTGKLHLLVGFSDTVDF